MIVCSIFLKFPYAETHFSISKLGLYNSTIGMKLKIVTGKEKKRQNLEW